MGGGKPLQLCKYSTAGVSTVGCGAAGAFTGWIAGRPAQSNLGRARNGGRQAGPDYSVGMTDEAFCSGPRSHQPLRHSAPGVVQRLEMGWRFER